MSGWIQLHHVGMPMMVNLALVFHIDQVSDGRARIVWQTSSPRAEYIVDESYEGVKALLA